jgi:6-phosphogluconolactonase
MKVTGLPNAQVVFVHDDLDDLSAAVAQRIAELAAQSIAERGVFHLALAGGETPRRCYQQTRQLAIDWPHVQVYFGDERCLPDGDAQRNDSMARESLLDHIPIPPANIHSIPAEIGAREAANLYAVLIDHIAQLDLVLLGMGEDGHTASLFPNNPATESDSSVVAVFNAPKLPAERVSLGMNTFNAARQRILIVAGSGKRAALKKIMEENSLPVARIATAEWHLDRASLPEDKEQCMQETMRQVKPV